MGRPTPESLAALRASAAPGLRENADAPGAAAREELLQVYRDRFRDSGGSHLAPESATKGAPWSPEDLMAFEWIDALAGAGHVGAARLRDRILAVEDAVRAFVVHDPARVESLVPRSYLAAMLLARRECASPNPDMDAIIRWLTVDWDTQGIETSSPQATTRWGRAKARWDRGKEIGLDIYLQREALGAIGFAMDELRQMPGAFSATDTATLGMLLESEGTRAWGTDLSSRDEYGVMLHQFAMARLASADALERDSGERLLERAAVLGSKQARDECLRRRPEPETICLWLDAERSAAVATAAAALRSLAGSIEAEDMGIFKRASGPHDVAQHGREPYVARLFYALARRRLNPADRATHPAGERLLECAAERGSRRAQLECYRRKPDADLLCRWLESGGEPGVAVELRESLAIAGSLAAVDLEILARSISEKPQTGAIVYAFANARLKSTEASERETGRRLLRCAAKLGLLAAKLDVVVALYDAALDKRAFVDGFMKQYPNAGPVTVSLCLRLGTALERGDSGVARDLEDAMSWYAKVVGREPKYDGAAGRLDSGYCYAVATAFDRREHGHKIDDPALAMAWHERGLEAGSARCFRVWMDACCKGEMGLTRDPEAALERVRRYCATTAGMLMTSQYYAQTIKTIIAQADRHAVPEVAAKRAEVTPEDIELEFWRAIKDGDDCDDFELYVEKFPNGVYASLAKRKIAKLRGAPDSGTLPISDAAEPRGATGYGALPMIDPALAVRWLRVAALMNSGEAMFRLGHHFLKGLGVERDISVARGWFEKAAAQGHDGAKTALTEEGGALPGMNPPSE